VEANDTPLEPVVPVFGGLFDRPGTMVLQARPIHQSQQQSFWQDRRHYGRHLRFAVAGRRPFAPVTLRKIRSVRRVSTVRSGGSAGGSRFENSVQSDRFQNDRRIDASRGAGASGHVKREWQSIQPFVCLQRNRPS
jgi:hypothetical protein